MVYVHTFSEAGGHPHNEDAFLVRAHPAHDACLLVALADGMGGQSGGGAAARRACEAVLDAAAPLLLQQADRAVCEDRDAGFTTLVGFAIEAGQIVGASCGDSALMTIDGPGRTQELTRQQRKNPPVGSGEATFLPFAASLEAPWQALAMSDGVWKYVGWERVREAARNSSGQQCSDTLQQYARGRSSGQFQDDFTVIVIQGQE